jgi:hypothetical protein
MISIKYISVNSKKLDECILQIHNLSRFWRYRSPHDNYINVSIVFRTNIGGTGYQGPKRKPLFLSKTVIV